MGACVSSSANLDADSSNHSLLIALGWGLAVRRNLIGNGAAPVTYGKDFTCNTGDADSIHRMGRSPGEGDGNPLQYFCLGSPMVREAWHTHMLSPSSCHWSSLTSCLSNPLPPPHSYWTTSPSSACTPKGCQFTLYTPLMTPVLIIVIFLWKNSSSTAFNPLGSLSPLFLWDSCFLYTSQYNEIVIQTMIENLLISEAALRTED